jgi:hypothetical protein
VLGAKFRGGEAGATENEGNEHLQDFEAGVLYDTITENVNLLQIDLTKQKKRGRR